MEEEEDVIFEGSPLDKELKSVGIHEETAKISSGKVIISEKSVESEVREKSEYCSDGFSVEIARKILESGLLVVEDEDFLSNFFVAEPDNPDSRSLGEAVFYSLSMAAVVGTVLFLSDRNKTALASLAALVPAGLAALASPSLDSRKKSSEAFLKAVSDLLHDMKAFKTLAKKSLNLIQGMELLHSGVTFPPLSSSHGGLESSSPGYSCGTAFPALRAAVYDRTLELIKTYREAVQTLMEVSPLADHVDYPEHYIAFVELEQFDITESSICESPLRIKALKDAVQLVLIQQSEYLRRFSLTFSDKARENKSFSKDGVLKHVQDLISTIKNINYRMSSALEYHEAFGIIKENKKSQESRLQKQNSMKFVPLRSVYTSLFSTGLHLQNSLIKVRDLEKFFDVLERRKQKKIKDSNEETAPEENQIKEWLKGFKEIQKELDACVMCIEEGVSHVNLLQENDAEEEKLKPKSDDHWQEEDCCHCEDENRPLVLDDSPTQHVDEVFEAVIDGSAISRDTSKSETILSVEEQNKLVAESRVLNELKTVLSARSALTERREAKAIARQNGLISPDMNDEEIDNILSQCSTATENNIKKEDSTKSVDLEEQMLKKELALVMEQINDLEEEIIKTDSRKSDQDTDNDDSIGSDTFVDTSTYDLLSSRSSSRSSSSSSSRATVKSVQVSPSLSGSQTHDESVSVSSRQSDTTKHSFSSLPLQDDNNPKLFEYLRSLSTPDLKRVEEGCDVSAYESFEPDICLNKRVQDNDSDPGSADELDNRILKVFKRPLRPAALKKKAQSLSKSSKNGHPSTPPTSSYLLRQKIEDLVVPKGIPDSQILGSSTNAFASQIRAKASAFKTALQQSERVFGNK